MYQSVNSQHAVGPPNNSSCIPQTCFLLTELFQKILNHKKGVQKVFVSFTVSQVEFHLDGLIRNLLQIKEGPVVICIALFCLGIYICYPWAFFLLLNICFVIFGVVIFLEPFHCRPAGSVDTVLSEGDKLLLSAPFIIPWSGTSI